MIAQLTGVLREVLAAADGIPRPTFSGRFTPEVRAIGSRGMTTADGAPGSPGGVEIVAGLPVPLVDSTDPGASYVATLGTLEPPQVAEALQSAISAPPGIAVGDAAGAGRTLNQLIGHGRADWRVTWYQGLADVLAGCRRRGRRSRPSTMRSLASWHRS